MNNLQSIPKLVTSYITPVLINSPMDTQGQNMTLNELAAPLGTYAAVKFSKKTIDCLLRFCLENGIKNALSASKFHTTLLYSRKHLPDLDINGDLSTPVIGTPSEVVVWETRSKNKDDKTDRCLVLKYKCKALSDRHTQLMDEHGGTYDFDEYQPHITLSYDIGDMDIDHLQDKIKALCDIEIVSEYCEDLELEWNKKK